MELGPFCNAIGIDEDVLVGQREVVAYNVSSLTNGVVWEIQKYRSAKKITIKDVVDWVIRMFDLPCKNSDSLQKEFENNIKNLRDLRNVMVKSPKQYKSELERLMEWRFELPASLGLEPVPKFEPATRANLGPKLLKVLKEKGNDDDLSMDMSGQSDDDDDDESRRRKAREELVQLKKDLGSARKIITSLNDKLNDLSHKCELFGDLSKTSVSQRRRIENDITKLKTEWNNIIENWHSCIERLNHVNNNKGNYLDVRYMVRRNKTRQGVFDELNLEFEKTVEEFKNIIVSTLEQERRKKKREARQKSKNGQKRHREESSDRDDSKVICLADASDNPVVAKLSLEEFLKSEKVEDFKGGKYTNSLKAIFLYLSSTPVPCPSPSEFIFTVLTQLEELKTDKISSQSFAGNILMEVRMLATLHVCSDLIKKSKVSISNESIKKSAFSNNSYTISLPDETHFVLGVRDISDGSPDTSFSAVKDIFNEFMSLKDNNEAFQALVSAVQNFVVDHQFLNKKIMEILFLYKQQLLPKYKQCLEIMPESLKAKFLTLNNFFTGLYFLQGLAMLSDVTVLVWELMALDMNASELSTISNGSGIHSSTLKKIYAFSELAYPLSDDASESELNTFLRKEKKMDCIPVAPFKDNIFNVVFHNTAALWFFQEVGYLTEYLNQMKQENKMDTEVQNENKSENVSNEIAKSESVSNENNKNEDVSKENDKNEDVSNGNMKSENDVKENASVENSKLEGENNDQKETNGMSEDGDNESNGEKETKIEDNVNTILVSSAIEKNCVCVARAFGLIGKLVAVPLWTVLEDSDTTDIKARYATLLQKTELWAKDASHFMTGQEHLFDDVPLSLDAVYVSLIKSSDVYDALTKEILELLFTAFIPYIKYFLFGKSENCVVEDKRLLAADSFGSLNESFSAFDRVTRNVHLSSSYALDAFTVFSKARNGQWLDRLCSKNSVKIVDMIKNDASKFLKSIYERKIILDDIKKAAKVESDAVSRCQEIEKKYKLIDDLVKCGGLWKSEKEIDDHLSKMKENERLNALKAQIQFRRHVLNEVHEEGLLDLASEGQCFNAASLCENLKAVLSKEFLGTESDVFEIASASDDEYFISELKKSCQNAEDKISTDKISFFTKENFQWLLGKLLNHTLSTDKGNESLTGVCIARKKSQGVYSYYIRYSGKEKVHKFVENKIAKDYQNNTLRVANPSAKDLIGSRLSRAFYKNDGELEWHDCKVVDILNDSENPLFAVEYEVYGANVQTSEHERGLPELQTLTFSCHLLEDYKTDRLRLL